MLVSPLLDPGAAAVFWTAFGLFALVEVGIALRNRSSTATSYDQGSRRLMVAAIWAAVVAAFLAETDLPAAAIGGPRWVLVCAGAAVMLAGTGLRVWSVLTLGRFFTVEVHVDTDQSVIERGPYRWVRHPAYLASLVTLGGLGLALGNWVSLAVAVGVPLAAIVRRISVEERALTRALGDPYRRYAAAHKRLIPGLW